MPRGGSRQTSHHPLCLDVSSPLVITVAGGKGGVGKSVVASNLAALIAHEGAECVLIDGDLGSPNQHTMFGCEQVGRNLGDYLEGRVASLAEVQIPTGLARLSLVAGQTGVPGAANPPHARKLKLVRALRKLEAEVVVVDLGAGVSHNVIDLFLAGDARLLVVAPQLTSVQNGYGFAKMALLRAFHGKAQSEREAAALGEAFERRPLARIEEGILQLAATEPRLAAACRAATLGMSTEIVGSLVDSPRSASVIHALSRMLNDYLHVRAPVSALVPRAESLHRSVNQREVLAVRAPGDVALKSLRELAERLAATDRASLTPAPAVSAWPPPRSLPPPDPAVVRALVGPR